MATPLFFQTHAHTPSSVPVSVSILSHYGAGARKMDSNKPDVFLRSISRSFLLSSSKDNISERK